MKLICKFCLILVICCFVTAVLGRPKAITQNNTDKAESDKQQTQQTLPGGKWGVSFLPFTGKHFSDPVMVSSVSSTTQDRRGPSVDGLKMFNFSNKTVNSVTVAWTLKDEKDLNKVLLQGNTPVIELSDKQMQSGTYASIPFRDISFVETIKPLLVNGEINGNFYIEFYISDIGFADGSTWSSKAKEDTKGTVQPVSYKTPVAPLVITPFVSPVACSKQRCMSSGGIQDCTGTIANTDCNLCSSSSCCNTTCGMVPCVPSPPCS